MKITNHSLPLLILSFFCLCLAFAAYAFWGNFVSGMVTLHSTLHSMLTSHIKNVSENASQYGGGLILVSFLYGAFHAVGPGHGKAVIVTYMGTHKESMWNGIFISMIAALVQAVVAVALVSTLAVTLEFNFHDVQKYGNKISYVSYALIVVLGLILLFTAVRRISKHLKAKQHSHHHAHDHSHEHGAGCGCSHAHVPETDQSLWKTITVILSMGFRPCTGAIIVLVYAHLVGVYVYGVIATLMMGLGTGLSVSLIAVAAQHARSWLEKFSKQSDSMNVFSQFQLSNYVRLIGGVFLVCLGWSLYITASTSTGHYHLP